MRTLMIVWFVVAGCGGSKGYRGSGDSAPSALSGGVAQREVVEAAPERAGGLSSAADAVGDLFSGPAPTPTAQVIASPEQKQPEKLVIEAWIGMQTEDVGKAAAAIRVRVEADGGRVVSENLMGALQAASSGAMELRVPPGKSTEFLAWLGSLGLIESRRILASDVSKQLFDQELALTNLGLTMARLQKLAERDVPMAQLIEIEKEMTRVRGDIERIKGEQRWLLDRVAFATISITLSREGGPVVFAPNARLHPGPRLSALWLLDPGDRQRSRVGGGVTLHIQRFLTFDLDVFPSQDDDSRTVIATIGSGLYSGFVGGGRRRWLNPYLGFRAGYGYLSAEHALVVAGEVGLELFKHKYLLVEVAGRTLAFIHDGTGEVAFQGTFGFAVPF
jgi:hypothetical protein